MFSRSLERLNYNRVTKSSFVSRVSERASLVSKVIIRFSTSFKSLDKLFIIS